MALCVKSSNTEKMKKNLPIILLYIPTYLLKMTTFGTKNDHSAIERKEIIFANANLNER